MEKHENAILSTPIKFFCSSYIILMISKEQDDFLLELVPLKRTITTLSNSQTHKHPIPLKDRRTII